ncbi:protochlorophyllide-dependent translocon component 52, chloroplastic-like isoform X1 [Cucurbita maxima]|uniref:Protochlorophyllide-dependent translocon component 52, chloroplastic-like isoform X1 n=1 Tax=Cucurbita maxima TaxID=3661 RepID=A0A6J1JKK6_CUCMA|nr:protochlorophyllide-dependent translocon component 52, chloroplastic-like isoform X1 [Cucurbita maxima]
MEVAGISSAQLIHFPTTLHRTLACNFYCVASHRNPLPRMRSSSFNFKTAKHPNVLRKCELIRTALASDVVGTEQPEMEEEEKFDWFAEWYPVMQVCDLDKRVPIAKKVLGLDLVVWWDRNENAWKVFDDSCPHRLAPLSEGRIDQWGRLQCVYHGWCFNGSGDCKFIPQAPSDGPPVHSSKKACVAVYPSTVQNGIVWFWPNSDPKFKDVIMEKKPPFIPELDDPSYVKLEGNRDMAYGYEILIENLMDPAHVPYAHYRIIQAPPSLKNRVKVDREGGRPLDLIVEKLKADGYVGKLDRLRHKFIAPCVYYFFSDPELESKNDESVSSTSKVQKLPTETSQRRSFLVFFCIPVSPGKSRLIWSFPRNFSKWINHIVPRWIFHIGQNLILDSDMYFLRVEEHKLEEIGPSNWHKACYVPVKSDALVVGFRRWLNKYAGGQVDWGGKYSGSLPPLPPREQVFERYWSHVVNCRSCNGAYKALRIAEVGLQVISLAAIGAVALTKQGVICATARAAIVTIAILCFAASKWLYHFIHKTFHFRDYNHALV